MALLICPVPAADKINVEHPSDDRLERYSKNRLTEEEIAPLKEHLLICEKCRNRLVQTDLNLTAIREASKLRRDEAED